MQEIIFFLLVPFIAMLYEGVHRKISARLQNRIGPPIIQPFYDIKKLIKKKKMKTQNDPFFRHAPLLYFLSTYAMFLFIPFSLIFFDYDFVFLLYLTILSSAFYVLAGLSSDNPFGIVGSAREMILMIVYEITLVIAVFNFMIKSNALSLINFNSSLLLLSLPLSCIAITAVSIVELHITPLDTAEAPTEIMSGSGTEYSGRKLAFLEMAKYMKRLFFTLLIPMFFFGKNMTLILPMSILMLFIYTFTQATTPRYRVDQAFRVCLIFMVLALTDFILVMRGIL